MVQYEIIVTGRVQGVGFRYFTKKQADILNLKGWVKNTSTGNVLVMVQGDKELINTFTDYLRIGPTMSRVIKVVSAPVALTESFPDFRVKY